MHISYFAHTEVIIHNNLHLNNLYAKHVPGNITNAP